MRLAKFIQTLLEDGSARVHIYQHPITDAHDWTHPTDTTTPHDELTDSYPILTKYEALARADWPGSPPRFDSHLAAQTAAYFYQIAVLTLRRDVPAEVVDEILTSFADTLYNPARTASAADHYAIDLIARRLPDLFRLTGGHRPDDPISTHLHAFAHHYPLASIGIKNITQNTPAVDIILDHPALAAEYLDRIIRHKDIDRLAHPRVKKLARFALDPHDQLTTPAVANAAFSPQNQPAQPAENA